VIDPHVHLRDWAQASKETVRHGLESAWRAGLDAVFEMPNTDPALTGRETILRRIELADRAVRDLGEPIFHGLFAGLTPDPRQREGAVRAWRDLFPRVVGLKMFAGHSTGNMGIVEETGQRAVYRHLAELGFTGVLAVHCEKEGLMARGADGGPDWDPARPASHAAARPPEAETASVRDQLGFAAEAGFPGRLHVCHASVPETVGLVRTAREAGRRVSCAVTPHHALLHAGMMEGPDGILLKCNPPLRASAMQERMLALLLEGGIDWIETDHAPHTVRDKREGHASGIPVLPFYPRFLEILRSRGMGADLMDRLTHGAICAAFALGIPNTRRAGQAAPAGDYPFDPFDPRRFGRPAFGGR
jgi:dihydroorotase